MSSEVICIVIAFITLFIGLVMAIAIAWCIPAYMVKEDYVQELEGDTPMLVRERCHCLTDNEKEALKYLHSDSSKKQLENWMKKNPSIVSVVQKKYVDDDDNLLLDYVCAGVVLSDRYIITGNHCLGNVSTDEATREYVKTLRVRSHSQYWSIGGQLYNITKAERSPDKTVSVFRVSPKFKFSDDFRQVEYPNIKGKVSWYYFISWKPKDSKYGVTRETHFSTSDTCPGKTQMKLCDDTKKHAANVITGRPFMSVCNELIGFEKQNDGGGLVDVRLSEIKKWVEGFQKSSDRKTSATCTASTVHDSEGECKHDPVLCVI